MIIMTIVSSRTELILEFSNPSNLIWYLYNICVLHHSIIHLARRARQFYRMREATLCDICEGSDCSDTCQIRPSQQRSAKSAFDDEEQIARITPTSHSIAIHSSQFILVAACFFNYFT